MNILLPIARLDALGSSPSPETGSMPEGESTGFAEALTAALVVPVIEEARPSGTVPASPLLDGGLIDGVLEGADEAPLSGRDQPFDAAARSGDLGPGLEAQAGLQDPPLRDGVTDHGRDRSLPTDPSGRLTDHAVTDGAEVGTQTAKFERSPTIGEKGKTPSTLGQALASRTVDSGRAVTVRPDHQNSVPLDAAITDLVDGEQADHLPTVGTHSLRANRVGPTEQHRPDPAIVHPRASAAPLTALHSAEQEPADTLQRGTPSALLLMAQQTRSSGIISPATSTHLTAGTEPAPVSAIAADPLTATPLPVVHRDPARPDRPLATRPDQAGVAIVSVPASDGLQEPALPVSRPSTRKTEAVATSDAGRADVLATLGQRHNESSSTASTSSAQNQAGRLQASPLGAQTKPVPTGAVADPSLQAAFSDVASQPDAEAGGSGRFQSFLAAEGDLNRLERLDFSAASNASARLPGTAPQPAASGQVALQIQRSANDGVDRFSLQLHPAELGSVDIELSFEGAGRMSALITAERPETLELLQRDSRLLERSLGDSGLKLSSDGLSFALKQDQQQQQPGQNFQQQAEAHENASRAGRAYDDAADAEQTPSIRRIDGLRLLDIET